MSKISSEVKKGGFVAAGVWFLAALFYLYEYIVRVAPSVMEEELEAAFNVGSGELSASLAMYYYIYAPMQLIVGILFDRFGARKLLVPASIIVGLGCVVVTIPSESLFLMSFGRALMGFGSAFGFVGAVYIATVWYPPHRLAMLSGLTTALGMLGAIMGQSSLSVLVDSIGWENSFFVSGILGVALALIILVALPRTPSWELKRRKKFIQTEEKQHNFLAGLLIVIKNPQTWIIGFVAAALFLPLSVFADLWGIKYIMHVADVSKTVAAGAVSMLFFGWLVGGPVMGWFSDHWGRRKDLLLWGGIITLFLISLLFAFDSLSINTIYFLLFCIGVSSSAEVVGFVAGLEANPLFLKGTSIAVINMIVSILGGICQPLVGYIMDTGVGHSNFRLAMLVLPLCLFIGILLCLRMKETYGSDQS